MERISSAGPGASRRSGFGASCRRPRVGGRRRSGPRRWGRFGRPDAAPGPPGGSCCCRTTASWPIGSPASARRPAWAPIVSSAVSRLLLVWSSVISRSASMASGEAMRDTVKLTRASCSAPLSWPVKRFITPTSASCASLVSWSANSDVYKRRRGAGISPVSSWVRSSGNTDAGPRPRAGLPA